MRRRSLSLLVLLVMVQLGAPCLSYLRRALARHGAARLAVEEQLEEAVVTPALWAAAEHKAWGREVRLADGRLFDAVHWQVSDGRVHLRGRVDRTESEALEALAEAIGYLFGGDGDPSDEALPVLDAWLPPARTIMLGDLRLPIARPVPLFASAVVQRSSEVLAPPPRG
jgi:hypothetical protein